MGERASTIVYATGADLEGANPITTVHPLSRQVQRFVLLVTLVQLDSLLNPVAYAAKSWTWSDDHRTLAFTLQQELRWHDGSPTTARDVAFTFDAARDPATGSPRAAELALVDSVRALSDTVARFFFSTPVPVIPTVFAELALAPEHILGSIPHAELRRASYNTAPVGNGPFRFERRDAGRRWVFSRNEGFPASMGGPPHFERLVVTLVDEPTTKFAGLVAGDLDVAGVAPTMAATVAEDPALRVLSYPVLFSNALVFNTARPPFDDVRVRRAIDTFVDRARIVDVALAGYAVPADGPVPANHPLWKTGTRLPPSAGDSLLDVAGFVRGADGMRRREGKPFSFELLTVGSGDNTVEQLIQGDLRAHGIELRVRQMDFGAFLAAARASPKDFDALVTGIPGDLSLAHLRGMFDSALRGGAIDYAGFHTGALDSAFARVRRSRDANELRTAWGDVQALLRADVPVSWLYHSRGVQGISRSLDAVQMDLRGEMVTVARWSRSHASAARAP